MVMAQSICNSWPEGKKFAFTIFDDTDLSTVKNTKEIYSFLYDLGFLTTKSIWVQESSESHHLQGSTCEDKEYLNWLYGLKKQGFELSLHNVSYNHSTRQQTKDGLEKYIKLFNEKPKSLANHAICAESIYWADARLSGINKHIYNLLTRFKNKNLFQGHIEQSPYFWGDLCKENIKYVRNFVYKDLNTLKECPMMPYHDPERPYVNYWFASSEGNVAETFINTISEENQDKLEEEGGAAIMYTHFGTNFIKDGKINDEFKRLMLRLSKKNGWFVPVSTLLDYLLLKKNQSKDITARERNKLERKWILHKIFTGSC